RPRGRPAQSRGGLMHDHAASRAPLAPLPAPRLLARAWRFVESESLLVLCTSIFAVAFVLRLSGQVNQDAWLGVLGGRSVVHDGFAHHETWTVWGAGKEVVDQQWL